MAVCGNADCKAEYPEGMPGSGEVTGTLAPYRVPEVLGIPDVTVKLCPVCYGRVQEASLAGLSIGSHIDMS